MDETLDYEKVIVQVDAAPEPSEKSSISIDLSTAFDNSIEVKELKYDDVSAFIDSVAEGAKKAEAAPEAKPKPAVQVQAAAPKHDVQREMEVAATKLRGMIGGAGKELEKTVTKEFAKPKETKLVMPTLSTQDQLADLEKIQDGIEGNLFTKDQMDIIIQEVQELSKNPASKETGGMSDEEKEVALMRDQKVKEIKVRLHLK